MCPFFSSTEPPVHHHQIKNGGTNNSHVTLLPHTVDTERERDEGVERVVGMYIMGD